MQRMTDKQKKTATALIKDLCCNYDRTTGGCLLLDLGEVVKCPQLITNSICCKYFRNVLLEDPEARQLKAEIFRDDHVKRCEACGQPFRALSNRAKYCAKCADKARLQRQREYMRKKPVQV